MSITNVAGTTLSKTALTALTEAVAAPDTMVRVNEDILQRYSYGQAGRFEAGTRLLFHAGQIVPQATLDALFAPATVTSVAPATGPAAGGTDIVIVGTNLGGVLGVSVGGVAATMVRVVSETRVTAQVPAHAAGLVNVVVTDDSGPATGGTGAFTYV